MTREEEHIEIPFVITRSHIKFITFWVAAVASIIAALWFEGILI